MKISAKLNLIAFFAFSVVLLIVMSLIYASSRSDILTKEYNVALQLVTGVAELDILTSDYLLFQEVRAKKQWYAKHTSLSQRFKQGDFTRSTEHQLAQKIEENLANILHVFGKLSTVLEREKLYPKGGATTVELQERLRSWILLESRAMTSHSFQLARSSQAKLKAVHQREHYLIIVLSGILFVGISLLILTIRKSFIKPIFHIEKGTKILAQGDLDHKLEADGNDEIASVAQALNSMAVNLKKTMASRDELTAEIAQRQVVEQSLRHSEERFRTVAEFAYDWEYWIGPEQTYIYISPSCERVTGYPAADFFDDPHLMSKITFPEDRGLIESHFDNELQEDAPHVMDFRIRAKDGTVRWINHICQPVYGDDGRFLGRRACNRDISDRKKEKLCLERLNELKGELLIQGDLPDKLRMITDLIIELFHADFSRIWMIGKGDLCEAGCIHTTEHAGIHQCKNREQCLHLIVSSGSYTHTDGDHQRVPLGSYKIGRIASGQETSFITNDITMDPRVHNHGWATERGLVAFAGYRLLAAEGRAIGVLALFSKQHISAWENTLLENIANTAASLIQLSQAIEQLREGARIQQVLLQEVNHRVKNNLTAIISMLHAEEDRDEDKGIIDFQSRMHDVVGRVEGLLTVHRLLSAAEWQPIALSTLCREIVQEAIKGVPLQQTIDLDIAHSDIKVSSDQAHYLTIVFNELATNSVKYALHDRETASIQVRIGQQGKDVLLVYCDDGPGYPEVLLSGENGQGNLGFRLIKGIVAKSLQGTLLLSNDGGAKTEISFPGRVKK